MSRTDPVNDKERRILGPDGPFAHPMSGERERDPRMTAYLCGDERNGLVCALFAGHPNDRGPGHVWVSIEMLIEAGTVAWHPVGESALSQQSEKPTP